MSSTASASFTLENTRLDYLDATRAFALLLGIVFHASLSFLPVFIGWAVQDVSTSPWVGALVMVSHSFRMELFFLIAGFFGCVTFHRKGAREFVRTRALRIAVPFAVGWFILRPLIVSGWIMGSASLRGDYDFFAGIMAGVRSLQGLPAGLFAGTHLWFLYYLAMITVIVLLVRSLLRLGGGWYDGWVRRADAAVAWLTDSPYGLFVLAAPTAVAVWYMRQWGMDTPDQSLRPHFPVLGVYGGIFILGWLLGRQPAALARFARFTPGRCVLATLGIGATLLLGEIQRDPGHPHYAVAHVGHSAAYALMMWSLVGLTLGAFKKFCDRPRPFVRYVADASYWLYLIHLPIVVWLQVAVAEMPLHWSLKLAGISGLTIAGALLSYDLFIRPTFVGKLLNGRRKERAIRLPSFRIRESRDRVESP